MSSRMKDSIRPILAGLAAMTAAVALAAAATAHEAHHSDPAAAAETPGAPPAHEETMQEHMQAMPGMSKMMPTMPGAPALMMPQMDPAHGRHLFASKGCVSCHSINGVGGDDAAALDAHGMMPMMNPFDFAAKMWRMAPAMIYAQEEELGYQILFSGRELADIIAFVHDDAEQHKFTEADIPPNIRKMMAHGHMEGHMHEEEVPPQN